ncbi:DUF5916 domain-containing protein [Phnomibacter ginsenosidimutans]|uniref:Uncharacterized protein n=1 Tax=Phnomibacter ginsenosidimutans TaxID=2676868 RepID=A0A6I6GFB1_9BACT|nr:DUF5916 domain-containing protein [Phnomibacter ginsenosidimutans]QGW29120.1 hypothetical protein GLV81_14295 [Phnomibacter ginsenosidimutans]
MRLYHCLLALLASSLFGSLAAQPATPLNTANTGSITPLQQEFKTGIRKSSVPITIDGKLDEAVWQETPGIADFWRKFPTDNGKPIRPTTVRITYDDKNLYVAAIAYDSGKAFIQTLKRDFGHDGSDGFAVVVDPLNQHTNGFFFVVNAFNSQSEDQLTTTNGPNFSWDNKWFSATTRHNDHWIAEIAIPFKTLRYKPEQAVWGLNFVRIDTKTNEYSCWTKVPVNFSSWDLGQTGALHWETPPPPAGSNMVLVPYTTGQVQSSKTNGENNYTGKGNAGFDAKIGLTSSLNLDLTVNPDFSQIEVDRQVTNLTRFNIFLPERRTFFLENADLFSSFGMDPIRPFYSRSIGLDKNGQPIPILGGARVTGSVTPSTRIGVMNMQTGNKGSYSMENFTAVSVNQRVLKRSSIRAYGLNRQGFLSSEEKAKDPLAAYGRNVGTEWVYTNVEGTFNAWGAYHKSFKPTISNKDGFANAGFAYNDRKFEFVIDWVNVGTNYYTDMGYVQRIENYDAARDTVVRLGFKHLFNEIQYRIFPKKGIVNTHRLRAETYVVWNPNGTLNERNHESNYSMQFKNTSNFVVGGSYSQVQLLYPISFTGGTPLPAAEYKYWRGFAEYQSDFRKKVAWSTGVVAGDFYNGQYTSLQASLTVRHLPHVSVAVRAEYNKLVFPGNYGSGEIFLIAPRIDINFTTSVFWTTFLQYNTQANNFNINSRFQWRFRPMSDLYLVYTDNYFTDPLLKNKNRALVLKLNYWINV